MQISNLSFSYGKGHNVIDNLSLSFNESGVYGLLGKNGTGKTTLLFLVMGLLRPKSGSVKVDGINTTERKPEVLREMFLVPEEYDLPRIPLMDYVKALKPLYPNFDETLLAELLQMFELSTTINLGALSMGMKKKAYICIALAARTRYLIMDEPTNGLDILAKGQFREVVGRGRTEGQTIIISTHQVHDVETIVDHVVIIDNHKVMLNTEIDTSAEVNLEQLFVDTLSGKTPDIQVRKEENALKQDSEASRTETNSADYIKQTVEPAPNRFWSFARYDLSINRAFYRNLLLTILGSSLGVTLIGFLLRKAEWDAVELTLDATPVDPEYLVTLPTHYSYQTGTVIALCFLFVASLFILAGHWAHNMRTRHGRINELSIPAANIEKFGWHVSLMLIGGLCLCFASLLVCDLTNWLLGLCYFPHEGLLHSFTKDILTANVSEYQEITKAINLGISYIFCYLSFFVLGNAIKYRYNIILTIIVLQVVSFVVGISSIGTLIAIDSSQMLDRGEAQDSASMLYYANLIGAQIVGLVSLFLSYRIFCRAQAK